MVLLSFAVVSLDKHSDHEQSAKAPSHHCCIQCCPSHNLAPLAKNGITAVGSTTQQQILPDIAGFPHEIYLNQIYRPPIV